jgi:hypothetical protein
MDDFFSLPDDQQHYSLLDAHYDDRRTSDPDI